MRAITNHCVSRLPGCIWNLSSRQIVYELGLHKDDAQAMTQHLRRGVVEASTPPTLSGTVEIDEVDLVAGHRGQHAEVQERGG